MFYELYEMNHAALTPVRAAAEVMRLALKNPLNPWTHTLYGRSLSAGLEVFERATRRYAKPEFGLPETRIKGCLLYTSDAADD